jgi:hypothetical protein
MQDRTELAGARSLGDLQRSGAAAKAAPRLQVAREAVQADDLLTIVYTSGTTADPKGVMLTHNNVLANVRAVAQVLEITCEDSFLSVLPAWHMYERIMDYLALATGAQLVYTERRRIKEDLLAVRPTVFAAVPRIWEVLHDGIIGYALKTKGPARHPAAPQSAPGTQCRQWERPARAPPAARRGEAARVAQGAREVRRTAAIVRERRRLAAAARRRNAARHGAAVAERLRAHGDEPRGIGETAGRNEPRHIGPPLPTHEIEPRHPTDGLAPWARRASCGSTVPR